MNALSTQAEQHSGATQTWLAVVKGVGPGEGEMDFWSEIPCNEFISTHYPPRSDVMQLSLCHRFCWAKDSDAEEAARVCL